jgi:hypothetical protein
MPRRRSHVNYNNADGLERVYMSLTPRPVILTRETCREAIESSHSCQRNATVTEDEDA